jgi:GT2 family glycosyltransferase
MCKETNPCFSVIVLNWNGRHLLQECLTSLRHQSYRDFEVILVDNGSQDGSVDYVRQAFPEARILALASNLGFCGGNNRGIAIARGSYILPLNNDSELESTALEELDRAVRTDPPDVGFWAVRMRRWHQRNLIDNCGTGYSIFGAGYQIGAGEPDDGAYDEPAWIFGAPGGGACYCRSMLDDIGMFDEDFFYNNEDVDLSFRAQLAGYRCHYVPSAIVYHRGSVTVGPTSDKTVYHIQRNMEWAFLKNMPMGLMWKYLPLHCLYMIGWLAYWTAKGRGRVVIRAKRDALLGWPKVRGKRREIQSKRRADLRYIDGLIHRRRKSCPGGAAPQRSTC